MISIALCSGQTFYIEVSEEMHLLLLRVCSWDVHHDYVGGRRVGRDVTCDAFSIQFKVVRYPRPAVKVTGSSPMSPTKDVYFVIGGSGFVGRHIVQQLLGRGDTVSVFDIVQRYHDVPFFSGDISNEDEVASALRQVCCNLYDGFCQALMSPTRAEPPA